MRFQSRIGVTIFVALIVASAGQPLVAQLDYRNLDAGRPVRTEDAYAIERFAFELVIPYAYENELGAGGLHLVEPELGYGLLSNMHLGIALPLAAYDPDGATEWGSAAPRLFALYNFNTESVVLPALALRADVAVPIGRFAAAAGRMAITGIATRSWGRTRAHVNASVGIGPERGIAAVEPIPSWAAGVAVDQTLIRQSLLFIGEIAVERIADGVPAAVVAGVGGRWQFTPTIVIDAGIHRRLTDEAGPDLGFTVGASHVFALAGLLPLGAP